jgi:prepilin-type N-terminal cleavage/methylation domain-containing protein
MQNKNNRKNGYTIIETMIAVSVFVIVVMIGMDALLNVGVIHQKSQNTRSLIDSLSFVMEDISKNLRTGTSYHCIDDNGVSSFTIPHSCPNGGTGISFKSVNGYQITYTIGSSIDRSVAGGTLIPLTPPEIVIDPSSGFFVMGAELSDMGQPLVTVRLVGEIFYKNVSTPFSLQTSVSQRLIDLP